MELNIDMQTPTFVDQSNIFPFPKVTPIRLPEIVELAKQHFKYYEGEQLLTVSQLEDIFRAWYSPLVDIDQFPYMYFMNNGITQALEYMSIHFKNIDIKMQLGDYFWLKTIKSASEVATPITCQISYDSNPSTIDGSVHSDTWDSEIHILDGAYIGTCLDNIPVPQNTEILLLGFSKNLGLPELRCGLILSKKRIQNLDVLQKTFGYVGLQSFNAVANICKEIDVITLANKLKTHQLEFCKYFKEFEPSQCALLATTNDTNYKFYKRPNGTIRIPLGESITTWLAQKNTL
jgi:hypothetical protein